MTGNDPITAIIDQLAAHVEQLTRLDTREAAHHAALRGQLAELTSQATAIDRECGHLNWPRLAWFSSRIGDCSFNGVTPDTEGDTRWLT